jgi:hypothetical protein
MGMGGPVVAGAPRSAVAAAPRPAVRVATAARPGTTVVHRTRPVGTLNHGASVGSRLTNLPVFSTTNVPGLGFDYPHLAAVSPQRGRRHTGFGQNVPFGFGGFLMSPEIVVENPQAVEEAQQAADEGAGPYPVTADAREPARPYVATRDTPDPAPVPKDAEEYVFVRRDGGLLFAVAYSWENGTLRYVTPEGQRKSVTQESLDMDATQQFNEQRGLSFRVPA